MYASDQFAISSCMQTVAGLANAKEEERTHCFRNGRTRLRFGPRARVGTQPRQHSIREVILILPVT